jgi:hypothetical protein
MKKYYAARWGLIAVTQGIKSVMRIFNLQAGGDADEGKGTPNR